MSGTFRFKKFKVSHQKSAMKVGTDGVLLGAWCSVTGASKILDVGSGSGVIALMLAQRNEVAVIDALDINTDAAEEACYNFQQSPWGDRLMSFHADYFQFASSKRYDLITCNPPFFKPTSGTPAEKRSLARQQRSFEYDLFFQKSTALLSASGRIAMVIPYLSLKEVCEFAGELGVTVSRVCKVYGNTTKKEPVRVLIEFSCKHFDKCDLENLSIEKEKRHDYTEQYRHLTKDFYLNF